MYKHLQLSSHKEHQPFHIGLQSHKNLNYWIHDNLLNTGRCQCIIEERVPQTFYRRFKKSCTTSSRMLQKSYPKCTKFHIFSFLINIIKKSLLAPTLTVSSNIVNMRIFDYTSFSKSFINRAYTWCTIFIQGFIKTWEEILSCFCINNLKMKRK